MYNKVKLPRLATNSIIYIFFNILQKAINFFLLPLYTIYLTPEDYGIINVLISAASLLTFFFTYSIESASSRFHYKYYRNKALTDKIWGSNLIFIIFNSFIWSIIMCIFYKYTLLYLIGKEISFIPYVIICILNCSFSPVYLYFQTYLQTTQRAKFFTINNSLQFFTLLFFTLLFVVVFHMKALGVILATCLSNFIFAIYAILSLRKYIIYSFSFKILQKSLAYSIPLLPHAISGWLNGMLDRIFINRIMNLTNVGLYSVSFQFGLIISLINTGIIQAYNPWFFQNHNVPEGKKKIIIFSDVAVVLTSVICLGIALFSQDILIIMTNEKFHEVWPSIVLLAFANLYDTIYKFHVSVMFLEKTGELSIITLSNALFTCILNYFLITKFGYIGASVTYFITQLITSIFVCYVARKRRPDIKFSTLTQYIEVTLMLFMVVLILYLTKDVQYHHKLVIKVISFILCSIIVIGTNRNKIKYIIKNKISTNVKANS